MNFRKYYGSKISLYFAWLGFYTYMLWVPAILGIGACVYGAGTLWTDEPRWGLIDSID